MPEDVTIRRLATDDADALKACFERCYGDTYVTGYFYEPGELRHRIASGLLRSVVAEAADGEIVGHMGLTLRDPAARTVDAGNTIVDPRHRGQRIVARLGLHLNRLCSREGFLGYHHYPTTAHAIMQKLSVADAGIETGVMLAYIPAGTEYREFDGDALTERPAATVVWRPFAACPERIVYLPPDDAEPIAALYARAKLPRTLGAPYPRRDARGGSIQVRDEPRRGLVRVHVRRPGSRLGAETEAAAATHGAEVVQVDLPLADPATPAAADALRAKGFLFCAVLPEYLDGDVLRLQRLRRDNLPRPSLATPEARDLYALIERDFRKKHVHG